MRLLILASIVVLTGCSAISPEEFTQMLAEGEACSPGETCVLSVKLDCVCPQPVTEAKARELDEIVDDVNCGNALALCIGLKNPRCEDGRCVADPQ